MNFKNIFKKQNVLPVAVLLAICIVVAGILGAVNLLTADRIADNENAKIYESLTQVLDGHITPLEKLPEGTPKSVTGIYEVRESSSSTTLKGKIVTVVVKGYAGDIAMTVGVKADGTVSKVIITSQSESHGKAGMSSYPDKFAGVSAENVGSVDLFTGATVSSTAIRNGVADAVKAAMGTSEPEPEKEVLPKTDEEILELAGELVGDGVSFTDVTPDDGETVKRVYKVSGSRGYVAYLVVMSRYGTPETETLVHFDNSGKIVSVEKLVWSPSPANPDYGYYPPAEDVVDAFYAKFVGHNSTSFTEKFVKIDGVDKEVEHAAGATSTSNNVAASIAEAFTFVDELIRVDIPRAESEVVAFVKELLGEGVSFTDVTPDSGEYVKRIYKANGNKGYVAYLVVMSRYGTPETETLVHFGSTGKILAVKKLVWSPSPANPDYGYYPPAEDVVDAFYAKFVGHNSASFTEKFVKIDGVDKEVEHAAGATSTSNNVAASIAEAFTFVDEFVKKDLPRDESEIKDLADTLVGGAVLTDITPEDNEIVKRLYKLDKSRGYIAYIVVMSRYGTPETETLVHFDRTGKIVAVKKIVWSPSPANPDYGYYPPAEDVVDAFYAKFVGQGSASFTEKFVKIEGVDKEVEHAAGATSTSNNVASAIAKAFTFVDELVKKDLPREESEIVDYAGELTGEDTLEDVTPGNTVFVKRLYKLGGNKGYVAYVVVISGYGTPETETLVHFDNTGKIAAVKKIVWSPSPANPDYPFYQPPTEDVVDAFYAKFIGHDSASFTEKFVKIEGVDKEVEHAAGTTTTSNNLANAIAEAFSYVDEMNGSEATGEEEVSYAARIIGIVILCASFAAVAAIIITKSIKRRRAK